MTDQATFEAETTALAETRWDRWIAQVQADMNEVFGGDFNLDRDQSTDGFSIDMLRDMFLAGVPVYRAGEHIVRNMAGRAA